MGAAREAALVGLPAVALSLQLNWEAPDPDFETAARWAKIVIDAVRDHGLPDAVYLNVNRGSLVGRVGREPRVGRGALQLANISLRSISASRMNLRFSATVRFRLHFTSPVSTRSNVL